MSVTSIQATFVKDIAALYEEQEARNIWYLIIENLTGINFRANKHEKFIPDGCFLKMLDTIKKRLLQQEPVQYILNEAWFYDAPFFVDKNVLIPRPETEELVHWVIQDYINNPHAITILDIGTGSGCIPITLKRKLPRAAITSCDVSKGALAVAKKNAAKLKADINLLELDILDQDSWEQLPSPDIIVSNPPYIPAGEEAAIAMHVKSHEPHLALFVPDNDPLLFYRAIADFGTKKLQPGGSIYLEIHENYGAGIKDLFDRAGYKTIIKKDMQGKDRMVKATSEILTP